MAGKKKDSSKGYEKLQELAAKAKVELEKILKVIGKEADLSSKFVKSKIDVLSLDNEIEKKYRELGKETYNLISNGKIDNSDLRAISSELDSLYDKLQRQKDQLSKIGDQIRKVAVKGS